MFIKVLRSKVSKYFPYLNPMEYSGHSFRIASATILALHCGAPMEFVKGLGDWKSGCYMKYICLAFKDKLGAGYALGDQFRAVALSAHSLPAF
jgi:hypothetical protein